MGKIRASLADVSTEFKPIEPGIYEFEITEVQDVENNGKFANLTNDDVIAYIIKNKVTGGDNDGRVFSDYINVRTKTGEYSEAGLATVKRYFEAVFGKEEVAGWSDDDFDTDSLVNGRFRGNLVIDSYTKQGETEPRFNNKLKGMEPI